MKPKNFDRADDTEPSKIRFDTTEQLLTFQKERREHLVVERWRKKFFLIATFKNIQEARNFIADCHDLAVAKKRDKATKRLPPGYIIWVCPDL